MIKQFSATNYYSINGTTSIDFIVDDKSSTGIGYHKTQSDNVSLIEAIIGPNASGKTTSLRALAFYNGLLLAHIVQIELTYLLSRTLQSKKK